jgi:hypothetical protein
MGRATWRGGEKQYQQALEKWSRLIDTASFNSCWRTCISPEKEYDKAIECIDTVMEEEDAALLVLKSLMLASNKPSPDGNWSNPGAFR